MKFKTTESTINQLIKNSFNVNESETAENCFRDFLGLHKCKQHLNRTHANKSNSITKLNIEIDGPLENDSGCTAFDPNITNENSFEKNIINCTFKDVVTNSVSSFIAKLYSKPNVTVPSLPPEYLSSLDNIFVSYLLHFQDRGTFKINNCDMYNALIKELINLEINGISVTNELNYDIDMNLADNSQTGLNEYCIFNNIPSFHVTRNSVSDLMHNITEGVARYDMALIIKNLIDLKHITLEIMNSRIEFFNYDVTENKNSPPKISSTNITNGCIIMPSSEMLCLLICPLLDKYNQCSVQLQALVAEHNRLYLLISKGTLKPKYHFLVHYGQLLLKNGPLILISSIRFEAKHKTVKAIANAVSNRINLGHTLSNKIQLQMICRFLSNFGLKPDLNYSSGSNIVSSFIEFPSNIIFNLPPEFKFLEINSAAGGCLFGEIYKMLINETRVLYFIIKPMLTVGFDEHFCAYEIKNNLNSKLIGCYMNYLIQPQLLPEF
ncbi:Uncharacterized protein FWK35_00032614, partial [Aphis craccivora]